MKVFPLCYSFAFSLRSSLDGVNIIIQFYDSFVGISPFK